MEGMGLFETTEPGELALGVVPDFKLEAFFHFIESDFLLQKECDVLVFEPKALETLPAETRGPERFDFGHHTLLESFVETDGDIAVQDFLRRIQRDDCVRMLNVEC